VFNTPKHFSTLDCWREEKISIPLDQVEKSHDTVFNRSGSKRANPLKITINTSKSSSCPPIKSFSNSLFSITKTQTNLNPPPMLLIWRWIFYPARPECEGNNHPITNLKPRISANTTVTSKTFKGFQQKIAFLLKFLLCNRNDLATKQPIS